MMDMVQTAAVATANAVLPGSGVIVNSAFELGKVCSEIAELLTGMQETATSIKTQCANIEKDVAYFRWVLEVLGRVQHKNKLTTELQKLITRFETEVKEYDRVMKKFLEQNILKQLVFHNDLDAASASVKETAGQLVQCVTTECAINGRVTYGHVDQLDERANRYMKFIDSPEVMKAMSDSDNQKEILAIIARMGRRNEAMMQSPLETNDLVLNVMKEKLWASSSRAVQDDVKNLPDWYITEDEVEIDMSTIIRFGRDAKIYRGALKDGTPVAVKVFNTNVRKSEENKQKFFNTMKLWVRLSHVNNICRLYGACYFTATPFIVMEYCELGLLGSFLRQNEANRSKFSLEILAQAAQAINKMHSKGFVHGDLKCDNILVSAGTSPQAKLCDFDRSFDWSALKDKHRTAADAGIEITDALRYLAPECVEGMLPNSKSDAYSFGMTLYHALAGASPYSDISSDEELRACKLARELPSRNDQRINDDTWRLISQCCDPAPDQRPTMEKVLEALKSLASQLPVETLVNATMDVQANYIKKFVLPTNADGTPVKLLVKVGSRRIPRSYKIVGTVILAAVAIGVIVGIVVGMKSSSLASGTSSNTGSGLTSTSSGSGSGSNAVPAPTPTPTTTPTSKPAPTPSLTPTPTLLGRQVSTILSYNTSYGIWGIAVASDGLVYLSGKGQILQMDGDKPPTVYAGSLSYSGQKDGGLQQATFGGAGPLAFGSNGDLFLCDNGYGTVRKISSTNVNTLASLRSALVMQGNAVDSSGNVYVSRLTQFDVVKITPGGTVTTFANSSMFTLIMGIAIDSSDNIYITVQHRVLKFTLAGEMSVVAGGTQGFLNGVGESARFSTPWALTIGSDGDLYVVDSDNNCIRKINVTTAEVTTYAGICGTSGTTDGLAASATFEKPLAIAAAPDNVFYVADGQGYCLRKIYTV